jgi:hypothetical protein
MLGNLQHCHHQESLSVTEHTIFFSQQDNLTTTISASSAQDECSREVENTKMSGIDRVLMANSE